MTDETQPPALTAPELLATADSGHPGWSASLGGPAGVERLTVALQGELSAQAEQLARLRGLALVELLETETVTAVAARLGMSRTAVLKAAARGRDLEGMQW